MTDGAARRPDSTAAAAPADAWASGLNDEQLRAVRHGMRAGPGLAPGAGALCVLAGPGTGKTRVITHRIARLIHADGAQPESIVALTFTVKAADEMRERLAKLVGPATAERVNAHTFHGFGRVLLRRFGDCIGLRRKWQLIDSAQRKRVLAGAIIDLDLFPHAAATGRTAEAPAVERFIAACRNRAIFPEDCLAHAERWRRSVELNERGLDEGALAAERYRAGVFHDLSRAFAAFERACRERHWLTFDDLLTLPIWLLREHAGVAAICREDYRHVVVDEFQDVNAAQIELLRLLAPARAPGRPGAREPDLCVVGDDDQAIYSFRGATEQAFGHFAGFWPGFTQVELSKNYRSTANVLNVANAVIARAERRFAPDKRIEAAGERGAAAGPGGGIEGVILEDDAHCPEVIGAMLRADRAANPQRRWKDAAVIARTNADLDRIGSELELDGIPVRYVRSLEVGGDEIIRDLHAWIELLVDPRARWAVQRVLGRPPLSVPTMQVGRWVLEHRAEMGAAQSSAGGGRDGDAAEQEPFTSWLARGPGRSREAHPGLRRFLELHGELAAMTLREPAHTVVLRIIEIVGMVEAGPSDGETDRARARRIAALVTFLRFSQSRIDRLEPPGGLAEFWSYYQDLDEADRRSLCADDQERIEDLPEISGDEDDDAVTLLSGHRAKGLEFDIVFLPRCRPGGFPARNRADEEPMLPEALLAEWQRGGSDAAARAEEERRLFYVACTRARERLVLLAKKKKSRGSTVDYFQELTLDASDLVSVRDAAEVLAACGAPPPPEFNPAGAGLATSQDPARRLGSRLRREARVRIGRLTLQAELDGLKGPEVGVISGEMGETAARLALAAHVERYAEVPAWSLDGGSPIAEAARLIADRLAGGESPRALPLLRPMAAPLKLSYSAISSYEACPRCFYLAQVLGLAEDAGPAMLVGQAAHAALDRFYRAFREADTGEARATPPTRDDLIRFGVEELVAMWPRSRPLDAADQDRLVAQLKLYHDSLHDPGIHVLEIEAWAGFAYTCDGVEHSFHARIDRVDQLPDGGVRIVDYKSGRATKRLLTPKADDLQLGVYALAARALLSGGGGAYRGKQSSDADAAGAAPLRGRAEYWLLSTGERGVIDLAAIDEAAIRARIDAAIHGMLEGRFPRGDACENGACAIFGVDD